MLFKGSGSGEWGEKGGGVVGMWVADFELSGVMN